MEAQPSSAPEGSGGGDEVAAQKEMRQQLEERIEGRRLAQQGLLSSLQTVVPDLVSSLDLFLRLISAANRRPFSRTSAPVTPRRRAPSDLHLPLPRTRPKLSSSSADNPPPHAVAAGREVVPLPRWRPDGRRAHYGGGLPPRAGPLHADRCGFWIKCAPRRCNFKN